MNGKLNPKGLSGTICFWGREIASRLCHDTRYENDANFQQYRSHSHFKFKVEEDHAKPEGKQASNETIALILLWIGFWDFDFLLRRFGFTAKNDPVILRYSPRHATTATNDLSFST